MLKSLSIQNYALIDSISLPLHKGMTAITGETGSGKSILLGAFGLLLGERADMKSIRDEKVKCIVEAVFNLKGYGLKKFFEDNDLDYEENTTVRREIAPGGKSRAFVNDTPVQLNVLRSLGAELVDIHSQHENSLLGERTFQFSVVDAFAGKPELNAQYSDSFLKYKTISKSLDEAKNSEAQLRQEIDFISFQLAELNKAHLSDLDQSTLEQELDTLNNAENIKAVLSQVNGIMEGDNKGVLSAIAQAKNGINKISHFNRSLEEYATRLESCSIELRELTREMEAFSDDINTNEKRAEQISEKLSALYHLQKKHRLNSVEELIALHEDLQKKADGFGNYDEKIESLTKELHKELENLTQYAEVLTRSRLKAAQAAQSEMKKYFSDLSLDHAELQIEITESPDFNVFGKNEISFLFRANKGGQLLPIQKVASGGEISRVMLAIKASISKHKKLPVLILDEIDQGVSGEVGKKIGNILKGMSSEMQLMVITHLPQIAGKAEHHLKVYKATEKNSTSTYVKEIVDEERINELAEMLSGKDVSKAAIENAKELMKF